MILPRIPLAFVNVVLLSHLHTTSAPAAPQRPNIVYIMSDELGYYELSCMGHKSIKTPRIDRLAAEGVRFTQALAGSSLCAPTRCCLMTGKHSGHTSVRTNGGGTPLRAGEETIASVLKKQGYATGGFGKWGCGGRGSTGVPEKHGFDIFVGYYDQVHAHSFYPAYIIKNSEELTLPGNSGGRTGKTYSQYVIFEESMKFIRANKSRPFFCYLPWTPPHGMFDIPEDDPAWKLYADKPWPLEARRYAAMVSLVDRQTGAVLDLLKELGLDRQTIVFFCGDNGGNDYFRDRDHPRGFHGPNVNPKTGVEFRGHKGNLYEGGLRVPMMVRWPGHIQPGRVSDLLWYFPDVLPTVAELAGAEVPADVDGLSIVPELLGPEAAGRAQKQHEYLYWELGQQVAVRMQHWKAIRPRQNQAWELYDLRKDISERHNLALQHADILRKLQGYARAAHTPAQPGTFADREAHERDRAAKWGDRAPPARRRGKVHRLPKRGLLSRAGWKIARVSSESRHNGRVAAAAIDGDPRTHWHTQFANGTPKHPHELVIDLGQPRTITAFHYLSRQDGGWNGAAAKCEFYVAATQKFGKPAAIATFTKLRGPQKVTCDPVEGRFLLVKILSEVNGGPWASAAEIAVSGR